MESAPERASITLRSDLFERIQILRDFAKLQTDGSQSPSNEEIIDMAVEGFMDGIKDGFESGYLD